MTRAARVEGAPTVPSRWLLRLDTVLRAAGLEGRLADHAPLGWQQRLDAPAARVRPTPPAPRPPVLARPRQLAVTEIETWIRDPYAIYTKKILRLRALDPIDADPGAADRGRFVHAALDAFLRDCPGDLPEDAEARLVALGREQFGAALERPGVRAFWWPRFLRIARWFVAQERARRPSLATISSERSGRLALAAPAGAFTLTAKADRIDRLRVGGLVLIDYKTGSLPMPGDVEKGFSPQLPLEAAIAEAGGFTGLAAEPVAALEYWRLSGGDPAGEPRALGDDDRTCSALIAEARVGLARLIAHFDQQRTPYRAQPRPEKAPRYSEVAHLARVKEWASGESE
jgi:ATP-dependent helicase/nuclease subunit B